MDSRESAFWVRLKANRWAYTFTILATLTVGILIGTIVSYGVKGKEGQKSSDATPLTIPAPQQLSTTFSQISKQLEPSVVNINTESTIKNPHRRRSLRPPDQDQDQGNGDEDSPFQDFFDKFFGGRRPGRPRCRHHPPALAGFRRDCGFEGLHRHQPARGREGRSHSGEVAG